MVGFSQDRVPKSRSDGGKHSGGGDSGLDVRDVCSSEMISDNDLRWVPLGSWEAILGKICYGKRMTQLIVAATGMARSSVFSEKLEAVDANFDLGRGGRADAKLWSRAGYCYFAQWNFDGTLMSHSDGSLGIEDGEQRILEYAGDYEVSSFPNTYEAFHRGGSVLRVQKDSRAGIVGGYTLFSFVNYIEVLNQDVVRFISYFREFRRNYRMIRESFRLRNITFVVTGLLELVRIVTLAVSALVDLSRKVLRRRGERMAGHSADFLVAYFFPMIVIGFAGLEAFSIGLMAKVFVAAKLKARQCVGQARIIVLSLFRGFIHAVLIGLDMCLFSVKGYTNLMLAKHGPVQCVWKSCSSSGWSGDTIPLYHDDCGNEGGSLYFVPSTLHRENVFIIFSVFGSESSNN